MQHYGFPIWLLVLTAPACATGFEGSGDAGEEGAADAAPAPDVASRPDAAPAPDSGPTPDAGAAWDSAVPDASSAPDASSVPTGCAIAGDLPEAVGDFESHTFAGAEGTREYRLYVPSSYDGSPFPLVVMIHGCTQTAAELAAATEYNRVAEAAGFLVLYPEQSLVANSMRCWNWFSPTHQQREQGEPALIVAMVDEVAASWAVDPQRTYMGGFSAGASMALVMGATYPDRFAAVASFAGCPFQGGCLGTESEETLVEGLLDAMGAQARRVPLFVANGTSDTIVAPAANDAVVAQWIGAADQLDDGSANHSIPAAPDEVVDQSENGLDYERSLYADPLGFAVAERWVVDGLGHAWCGGSSEESYSTDLGPSLSRETYRFFCENPLLIP